MGFMHDDLIKELICLEIQKWAFVVQCLRVMLLHTACVCTLILPQTAHSETRLSCTPKKRA